MRADGYRRAPLRNDVVLALMTVPLYAAGTGRYGLRLLAALGVSVAVGLLTEAAAARLRGRRPVLFGLHHWMLIPLILPPVFPLWMVGVSVFFGTLIGTVFFGGHGRQAASPVAIAWAFAALSFQAAFGFGWSLPFPDVADGATRYAASVLTIDHPVEMFRANVVPMVDLLAGRFPQTPGNAVPLLALVCGGIVLALRAVDVRGALAFLGVTVGLTVAGHCLAPELVPPPAALLVGNVIVAGCFVFGDTRTAARTRAGRWLTGCLAGALFFVIRSFSDYAGGVFFGVLLANVFAPILDEAVFRVKYGGRRG